MNLDKIFKALSDETRLRIINILQQCQGCCVCDLEKVLEESQPKISRHLAYLKRENLVKDERYGTMVIYSLDFTESINEQILHFLQTIFSGDSEFEQDRQAFEQLMGENQLSSLDENGKIGV
jgi:ArsR family transcriptional regulator